jgi:hypothetical protein
MDFKQKSVLFLDIVILIIVFILLGLGVGIWWNQHQKAIKQCKERCKFGVPRTITERKDDYFGGKMKTKTEIVDVWGYYPNHFDISPDRIFET